MGEGVWAGFGCRGMGVGVWARVWVKGYGLGLGAGVWATVFVLIERNHYCYMLDYQYILKPACIFTRVGL